MTINEFLQQARAIVPQEYAVCVGVEMWHHVSGSIDSEYRIWWNDKSLPNGKAIRSDNAKAALTILTEEIQGVDNTEPMVIDQEVTVMQSHG